MKLAICKYKANFYHPAECDFVIMNDKLTQCVISRDLANQGRSVVAFSLEEEIRAKDYEWGGWESPFCLPQIDKIVAVPLKAEHSKFKWAIWYMQIYLQQNFTQEEMEYMLTTRKFPENKYCSRLLESPYNCP